MNRLLLPAIVMAALLLSCTTLTDGEVTRAALDVTNALSSGDIEGLNRSSGTPFLFETEVLAAPVQVSSLWDGLVRSGYDFSPSGPPEISIPDGETWQEFSSSRDVRVWFERHAPEKAAIVVIPVGRGHVVLVIDRQRRQASRIRAFKVDAS